MAKITSEALGEMVEGQTIPNRFLETVCALPDQVALRSKATADQQEAGDGWAEMTYTEYSERAAAVGAGLAQLGVERGDRVALLMRNRPEFHVADMGVLLTGATPISVYNSSAPEQIQYLAGHSEAKVIIVEDVDFLERVLKVRGELDDLEHVVIIDDPDGRAPADVRQWHELLEVAPLDLGAAAAVAHPEDLATVIYTSGTTGPPKGVMLDHANLVWTVESLRMALGDVAMSGRRMVSYLPMAHIAERMTSHYQGACLGYEISTCPEPGLVASYLPEVKPEIFFAVPRVWEKMYAGIQAAISGDADQRAGFEQALAVGQRAAEHKIKGEELPPDLAAEFETADATLSLVRQLLGLDQVISAISGAAPIPVETLWFFLGLGIPISEIYGMSESSGPMTWEPFRIRPGTVGPPIAGQEVKLGDDGEVMCRGGNVFRGYLKDDDKTAATLDADGWLHSGDIGEFDDAGFLRIVDRKKELIVTAGGKNISPANLEAALKVHPLIGQACVIGDGKAFVSALIVLDPEVAPVWAQQHGLTGTTLAELSQDPAIIAEVQRGVDQANQRFSQVERVKKFTILHEEWMPDSEELTPTMKLKRRGIHQKYAEEIEALYD
jgi:long-chain acyl-CoA synthetase